MINYAENVSEQVKIDLANPSPKKKSELKEKS